MANTHRNSLPPGHKLLWYEIRKILGQGGFGITYLAHDMNLDRDVAIKEYLPVEFAVRDESFTVHPLSEEHTERYEWGLKRFIAEARTLTRFRHPSIVRVDSVFEENNSGYMVMQYEGVSSLQDILQGGKTLDAEALEKIVQPLLDGLEQVHHMGFIHRDIKPDNIYLRKDGSPVLLDFGSARQALGEQTKTLTSLVSPGYAPYEQYYSKSDEQGAFSDIYGLGATLYRAVTGKTPLDAIERSKSLIRGSLDTCVPSYELARDNYPENFLRAIDHAMRFKAEERPQSIEEWRKDFDGTTEWPADEPVAEPSSTFLNITENIGDKEIEEAISETPASEPEVEPSPAPVIEEDPVPSQAAEEKPVSYLGRIVVAVFLIGFFTFVYLAWQWFERETRIQYPEVAVEDTKPVEKAQPALEAQLEAERFGEIEKQKAEEEARLQKEALEREEAERLALEEKTEEEARLKKEALEREEAERVALEKKKEEADRLQLEKEKAEQEAEAERVAALEREQAEEDKAAKGLSMSESVFERLKEARALIATQQLEQGLATLRALEKDEALSPYERAQVQYSLGFALTIANDYAAALSSYENVLKHEGLPASLTSNTLFSLAQIHYDKAEYRESLGLLKKAYNLNREYGEILTENFLQLMKVNYQKLGDDDNLLNINRRLVALYPKTEHWLALAESHANLGQHEDQIFILEQLYDSGELSTAGQQVGLVNLLVLHGDPARALEILEKGMAEGLIEKSKANILLLSKAQKMVQGGKTN